jgi:hypothetical protein
VIGRIARAHLWIAAVLAAIVVCTGLIWNTRVAAGSDAYGCVSQVDLWLRGGLHIDQSFGATVPWPNARWTFTPLGYRPEPDGYRIVPQYSAAWIVATSPAMLFMLMAPRAVGRVVVSAIPATDVADDGDRRRIVGGVGLSTAVSRRAWMLGCIGVAPARKETITTGVPGASGGNMDYASMGVGMKLMLPVNEPGALLSTRPPNCRSG